MVDQSTQSSAIGSGNYSGKSPDELITHGKQLFQSVGKLDRDARDRVFREWSNDPAAQNALKEMTASTA